MNRLPILFAFASLVACSSSSPAEPTSTTEDTDVALEDTFVAPEDTGVIEEIDSGAIFDSGRPDTKKPDTGTIDTAPPPDAGPPGQRDVVAIGAGQTHTCIALTDGTVRCTGENDDGQLGNGTTTRAFIPVKAKVSGVISVAGGFTHTCIRHTGNTVSCWGSNDRGQLGDGTTTKRLTPVAVLGLTDVIQLSAGRHHTCALIKDGTVKCWGSGFFGQLGDGTTDNRLAPVAVSGLSNASHISLGSDHSCALLTDKTVKCWGDGSGFLGKASKPIALAGASDVRAMSAGTGHTCVVIGAPPANKVMCIGSNGFGQLGDSTLELSYTLVQTTGVSDVIDVTAGRVFTCARLSSGSAKCWGSAQAGAMGDGTFAPTFGAKGSLVPLTNIVELDAGGGQVCARLADTSIKCWGSNLNGYLGDGTSKDRALPVSMLATP